MDLVYLKKLIKIFDDSNATTLDIDEKGFKINLSKSINVSHSSVQNSQPVLAHSFSSNSHQSAEIQSSQNTPIIPEKTVTETIFDSNLHTVMSPIVGTFYRSPSPESPTFVDIGTRVVKGQTLCIIEAMKLMNEIESDADGIIEKILVQNAQPVEYNQPLFVINPA